MECVYLKTAWFYWKCLIMCKKKKKATCQRKWKMRNSIKLFLIYNSMMKLNNFTLYWPKPHFVSFLQSITSLTESVHFSRVVVPQNSISEINFFRSAIIRNERRTKQNNTVIANGKATHAVSLLEWFSVSVLLFTKTTQGNCVNLVHCVGCLPSWRWRESTTGAKTVSPMFATSCGGIVW